MAPFFVKKKSQPLPDVLKVRTSAILERQKLVTIASRFEGCAFSSADADADVKVRCLRVGTCRQQVYLLCEKEKE
jgi:hypothetical protein